MVFMVLWSDAYVDLLDDVLASVLDRTASAVVL